MTTPRILVPPNVLSSRVAPNTLRGLTRAATPAPLSGARGSTTRQLWRVALFIGFGLALGITIIGGRSW
jgi:hypothetical protein